MVVGVLAGADRDRNLMLADDLVGEADIVEVIDLDHQMVDTTFAATDSECDGVVAIIAVHEDGSDRLLAHPELVFDAAAHPEQGITAMSGRDVTLADYGMAHAAGAGLE